jgi:tetratricopeptide (TPR) repeat protein
MIIALALLLVAGDDPRPWLVELQLTGRHEAALAAVEETLRQDPEASQELGLDYLRGHLLEVLGRTRDAHEAFAQAMVSSPALAGYSRYRLAVNQYRMGHPEVAAGLLATLLGRNPPAPLFPDASPTWMPGIYLNSNSAACCSLRPTAPGDPATATRRPLCSTGYSNRRPKTSRPGVPPSD